MDLDRTTVQADRTTVQALRPELDAAAVPEAVPVLPAQPRTVALMVIALILVLFAIRAAAAFLIPLLLSLFLNYALSPVVARLERWHLPRVFGATLVVALTVAIMCGIVYRLGSDAADLLEQLPAAVQRVRLAVTPGAGPHEGALEHMKRTATELEKLATVTTPAPPAVRGTPAAAALQQPSSVNVGSIVLSGTSTLAIAFGQVFSALFLTYFLLCAGKLFRRKLLHAVGPPLARQKMALRILNHVDHLNQHYFAVVLIVNVTVGFCTWIAMYAIGLDKPAVWGIAAAVLHTIPYVGSALVAAAAGLIAYGQFGTLPGTILAASFPLLISIVFGMFVQTWLMGRAARMNAPAVFVALLFWGMLWGGWGLLLAVPIMVAVKTVCDHVPRLKPFGELLSP